MCRNDLPATWNDPHNGAAGQPSRQSAPVELSTPRRRPPARHRRGRSPSMILRATTPMVRRWAAEGGPEGRSSGTLRQRGPGARHPTWFAANNVACLRTAPIASQQELISPPSGVTPSGAPQPRGHCIKGARHQKVPGTDLPIYALRTLRWQRTPTVLQQRRNSDPSPGAPRPVASSSSLRRVTSREPQPVRSPSHQIAQHPPFR